MPRIVSLLCVLAITLSASAATVPAGDQTRTLTVGGIARTCILHIPPGLATTTAAPVIYALHGRFGTGANTQSTYGFDTLADANGVVMVYPDGYQKSWNDGRGVTPASTAGIDDVAFFDAMQVDLASVLTIDATRVFVCGMSNGGFMTQRLGVERASRFAAIGSVAACYPSLINFAPAQPVSVLHIHGTADTLAAYAGGTTSSGDSVLGAEDLTAQWRMRDGLGAPLTTALPDTAPGDGCTVDRFTADGGTNGTAVHLYRVNGGGHNWPGHRGALDIGNLCLDIDATVLLMDFFLAHPKAASATGPGGGDGMGAGGTGNATGTGSTDSSPDSGSSGGCGGGSTVALLLATLACAAQAMRSRVCSCR